MARYLDISEELRGLIRRGQVRPGEPLPSERVLARQYGVSHSAIRMASDLLVKEGLVVREHGRGTFVAKAPKKSARKRTRRLGLLYVDQPGQVPAYSQRLTRAIQACAQELGYELLIEQMRTEDLVAGRVPAMVARRSVDGVLLDGRIAEFHANFLQDQAMPYVATGLRRLGTHVPQVRPNIYRLARELTRELIESGFAPIWLESSPGHDENYLIEGELVRGHMDELRKAGRSDMRLFPMRWDQTAGAVGQLLESDLSNAAVIVQGWVWPLVAETLIARAPEARGTLFVPLAARLPEEIQPRCRYVRWLRVMDESLTAAPAVRGLVTALEGGVFQSVSLEPSCRIAVEQGSPETGGAVSGEFSCTELPMGPRFVLEERAAGMGWKIIEGEGDSLVGLARGGERSMS
jgi:DNA-binding transcriptional regulator YhcF (GntR family)